MSRFVYKSTKTYCHNIGLSVCFRQWRAKDSHCRFLHGYALQVKLTFEAEKLDDRNWVIDFGGLGAIKAYLQECFDHKMLVAVDDPERDRLWKLQGFTANEGGRSVYYEKVADVIVVPNTGCEAFAEIIYGTVDHWLTDVIQPYPAVQRVTLRSVEVCEHGGNSAIYERID